MHWRWLFIDEVSMVSPKLLAELDMKLRTIMSDVGTLKKACEAKPDRSEASTSSSSETFGNWNRQAEDSLPAFLANSFEKGGNTIRSLMSLMGKQYSGAVVRAACKV